MGSRFGPGGIETMQKGIHAFFQTIPLDRHQAQLMGQPLLFL
jgi:hypothetical protein